MQAGNGGNFVSAEQDCAVLVIGGGPAGSSAEIYAARKGIRTGVVAERFGGQVMDTLAIENFISVKETEGPKLVMALEEHVKSYDVDIMNLQRAKAIKKADMIEVELESGATLRSKSLIIATAVTLMLWRATQGVIAGTMTIGTATSIHVTSKPSIVSLTRPVGRSLPVLLPTVPAKFCFTAAALLSFASHSSGWRNWQTR